LEFLVLLKFKPVGISLSNSCHILATVGTGLLSFAFVFLLLLLALSFFLHNLFCFHSLLVIVDLEVILSSLPVIFLLACQKRKKLLQK